jgi:hypothetical protein
MVQVLVETASVSVLISLAINVLPDITKAVLKVVKSLFSVADSVGQIGVPLLSAGQLSVNVMALVVHSIGLALQGSHVSAGLAVALASS